MDNTNNHIITTQLNGGLGNQLFEIAVAYVYSLKYSTRFIIDRSAPFICSQGNHPTSYINSIYKKILFVDSFDKIDHLMSEHDCNTIYSFDDLNNIVLNPDPQVIKFDGYFQSDAYYGEYSNMVKQLFTPDEGIISYLENNSDIFDTFPELKQPNDFCFIGIRRGDYIAKYNVHNPCGMTYFNKAMNMMNKTTYYISTDDYEWARKNFTGSSFRFLDVGNDIIQFYAACLFKNYIISNSSFHWWASYLSIYDNPRIIAPDKWLTINGHTYSTGSNIYRKDMEIIERPVETT
jgi:hypothetical protein